MGNTLAVKNSSMGSNLPYGNKPIFHQVMAQYLLLSSVSWFFRVWLCQ